MITPFDKRDKNGWPHSMHIVPLGAGELLVHSPTWIDDTTFENIDALGKPRLLLAPNHFHHMSLARFRERYPDAVAVAAAGAIPRLEARGHHGLKRIEQTELPNKMRWLVPCGTKGGEAWVAIDSDGVGPTWIVCDAFFDETRPVRGFEGKLLRAAKITPGLCIGATFTLLCISDKKRYARWVLDAIERDKPARVLFSHGQPLQENAAARLTEIVQRRLG